MKIVISLLRGINVGGHRKIGMEALRGLYESLGLVDPRSCLQSGNVVFRTAARDLVAVARSIEDGIENSFGFRAEVITRTLPELRDVIARNPFADRDGIDPSKLLVSFLAGTPGAEARESVLAMGTEPEELRIDGRELYMYFPNGMGRPKIPVARIEKMLKTPFTGRNWNTVIKLLQIAEAME